MSAINERKSQETQKLLAHAFSAVIALTYEIYFSLILTPKYCQIIVPGLTMSTQLKILIFIYQPKQ